MGKGKTGQSDRGKGEGENLRDRWGRGTEKPRGKTRLQRSLVVVTKKAQKEIDERKINYRKPYKTGGEREAFIMRG